MKICSKCKKRKPISEFHKDKQKTIEYASCCKECRKIYAQRYYQLHKTKILKHNKNYYQSVVGHLRKCFSNMKQRCCNPKCKSYKNYGGRGIKCLFESSDDFVDYVTNELKTNPSGLEIDRIDNNGHYEKDNIRFVIRKINRNNRK